MSDDFRGAVRQVSSDVATMQRGTCGHAVQWHTRRCFYAAPPPLPLMLCVGKLVIL